MLSVRSRARLEAEDFHSFTSRAHLGFELLSHSFFIIDVKFLYYI
jgi:hypothetical protein